MRTAATAQWLVDGNAADLRLVRETARDRRFRVDALHEPDADRRRIPSRASRSCEPASRPGPCSGASAQGGRRHWPCCARHVGTSCAVPGAGRGSGRPLRTAALPVVPRSSRRMQRMR